MHTLTTNSSCLSSVSLTRLSSASSTHTQPCVIIHCNICKTSEVALAILGPLPAVVDCGNAGSPANGRVSFASTILRSTAIYSCDSGYSLRGVSRRECQESGTWSGSLPACQLVDCGDPGQLENGVRSLVSMTFGSTVTFSCNLNFTLSGPNQRVCQADGFWSDFQPVCKRKCCLQYRNMCICRYIHNCNFGDFECVLYT